MKIRPSFECQIQYHKCDTFHLFQTNGHKVIKIFRALGQHFNLNIPRAEKIVYRKLFIKKIATTFAARDLNHFAN